MSNAVHNVPTAIKNWLASSKARQWYELPVAGTGN